MSNKLKSFLILFLLCGSMFLLVPHSFAATVNTGAAEVGANLNLGNQSPYKTVTTIINVLMGFLSLLALCLILWGGFIYMTSNGSEEKIEQSKKILRNGAIGLVIILSAWGITFFIFSKLLDATGGAGSGSDGCTNGASVYCGCGGAQSCNGGTWGPCLGSTCQPIIDNKTSCDGKTAVASCQADNALCGSDYTCDTNDCLCKPKSSLGDSCNASTSGGKCTADDNLCGPYLKCDTNSCTCTGSPVITGISPAGGFCLNDQNRACNLDSDCLGGAKCDSSTPNGTTNNFITIYGYNFGTSSEAEIAGTGQVIFNGASAGQARIANSPKLLNPTCVKSWTDRQIIVAVPGEVVTGPVSVKRDSSANNIDTTNDSVGPKIADFVKNDITRPGLCQISPTQGALGAKVGYQGVNLKDSVAYFGEYSSAYKGINSTFLTDNLSGQTLAPSIVPGQTTTFVEKTTTGVTQKSNALVFIKEKEAEAGPYISSFYPASGAAGQYITILGSGFGNLRGSRQVFFGDKEASYAFPDACANAIWTNNQVVVKVPDGLTAGSYEIKMNLGDITINTDLLSPNNNFKFNPAESLKTSLCKIDPARGQIGDKVSLWGEYFGNIGTDALVVFSRGISTSSKITKEGTADKIQTTVPTNNTGLSAITGPVHVMKNGEWGNELNFTVGKCTSNAECNSASPVCCPGNTYKTGSCESTLLSCYFEVPNSVYETKFNTALAGSTTDTPFDSCIAMASFYKGCQTGQFCPNSPGKCSPFNPIEPIVLNDCGSATSECGALDACKDSANTCIYDKAKDVCQTKQCVLENELPYSLTAQVAGKNVVTNYKGTVSCRAYNDKATSKTYFVKQLKVNTSCPAGYVSVGDGYCVNAVPVLCDPCPTGFSCNEDGNLTDDLGICESTKICGPGASCGLNPTNSTKYSCLKIQNKSCDCCCEIGQDTRDCCAPLKCAGTCGSDTSDDGAGYGSCSGCSAVGSTQAAHDAACNCSTSSGKICDTSKSGGVCTDCAALDEAGCSAHAEQCCFDSAKGVCQGGNGTILPGGKCAYYDCDATDKATCNQTATTTGQFLATSTCITDCAKSSKTICDLIGADADKCSLQNNCCFDDKTKTCTDGTDKLNVGGIKYCAYYNCDISKETCGSTASTTGDILGLGACNKACSSNPTLPGLTCGSSVVNSCDTSFCGDPYKCLSGSGSGPSTQDCGTCCCTPGSKSGDLTCIADQGSCSGGSRGLFCGCSSDTQCGKDSQGCGGDTCCHGRPMVASTEPKNNTKNVCRNRQIEINFNQEMNIGTLASNILLVEEKAYGTDTCPNGTTLALGNYKPKTTNFLARLFQVITGNFKRLFSGSVSNTAIAAEPSADKLYCVAPITVEAKQDYYNGATSTKVYIQPQKLLSAQTNYFVVVKGDENLDSNSGVMSLDKIGLNAAGSSPIPTIVNSSKAVFNGVSFNNAYAFNFTTMSDSGGKNGLCTINSVVVNPNSFLINVADNDTSDDNPGDASTFNKKNDSDRAVAAFAYSADNQLLYPISGYAWKWDWKVSDSSVVKNLNISDLRANQIVVGAVAGVTDKSTKITATVNMEGFSNAMVDGAGLSGSADAYVFLCANPWPMEKNGIWNPWVDTCVDSNGNSIAGCTNYNYKFYYCRDAGAAGTADDLPAVADPALILGSSGTLICSNDGKACSGAGSACGTGGTCIWNVLKESYFFREVIPQAGEITEINSTGAGGSVIVKWYTPIVSTANIDSFKIYYGLASGKSSSYITTVLASDTNHCIKSADKYSCSFVVDKLTDGEKYYFKVSALTDKKAESPLSGSKEVTPTDTTAPVIPTGLKADLSNNKLTVSWKANTDDTLYYRLFHGILAGKKAADSVDSPNKATSLVFDQADYRAGDHFFFLAAIDKSGNVGLTSDEVKVTVPAN